VKGRYIRVIATGMKQGKLNKIAAIHTGLAVLFRRQRESSANGANRRFKFHKRRQQFIRTHNERLSVVAMRVHNPDPSPVGMNR